MVLCLLGPAAAVRAAPAPAGTLRALRVTYETRGLLPGEQTEKKERVYRQIVTVDPEGTRLTFLNLEERPDAGKDAATGADRAPAGSRRFVLRQKLILRMDREPPVIYEILAGGTQYREHEGDLNDLQRDRRILEKNELERVKRYPAKDREAYFKRSPWMPRDGVWRATLSVENGDVVLGRKCQHVRVLENGREIINLQVATQGTGAQSYFHLYRRLGAFSEEVLEKIEGIKGLPLKGSITIVTALPTRRVQVEAKSIQTVSLPPDAFELPPGAVRVDETPENLVCGNCGKAIDAPVDEVPAKGFFRGKWVYFCSEKCAEEYATRRVEGRAGGARHGGRPPAPNGAK